MTLDESMVRALVGAALYHPPFAAFVGIALDKGEIASGLLQTVAIAVAYNNDHSLQGGVEGAAERLAGWGELQRVGLDTLVELAALRRELEGMLSELQMSLDNLPPIDAEPIVRVAAELFGAEPMSEIAVNEPTTS